MKSKIAIIAGILVAANLLTGLLLSSYSTFNILFTTIVLLLGASLIYIVNSVQVSDAIKVSLTILLSLSCLIKFTLGLIAPEHIQDNWCLIVCVIMTVLEIVMIVVYHKKHH